MSGNEQVKDQKNSNCGCTCCSCKDVASFLKHVAEFFDRK